MVAFPVPSAGSAVEAYPAVYTHSGSTDITNTAATVGFDTETLDSDGVHSIASSEITIGGGNGVWLVAYSVPINDDGNTGNVRDAVFSWVERDTGGGFTTITQSRAQAYLREDSGGEGIGAAFICELDSGDDIRLRIQQTGTTDVSTETGQAQISLSRVRG